MIKISKPDFWESKFSSEGPLWDFYPSDSAIEAVNIFRTNGFKKILIPGAGYGRNARFFIENGFDVTGIEISASAIKIAASYGIRCTIHHGSVADMPFDNEIYDGIFCYALIHVLGKTERRAFLRACYDQLKDDGLMMFVVTSVRNSMFGSGRPLARNRFEVSRGLKVFFYDEAAVESEFKPFGLISYEETEEPVKFMKDQPPMKMFTVICKKQQA